MAEEAPKIGLGAAMMLKKKAATIAAKDRVIDAKLWTSNVSDLVQVMSVAQGLYVVLEQCNEAVLRVAVELCTCRQARKTLWWPSSWEGDFDKREQLKGMIKEKIALAISAVNGRSAGASGGQQGMGAKEVEILKRKAAENEARANAAEKQQKLAEAESREAKAAAEAALAQVAELEKSLHKMREDLKRNMGDHGKAAEEARAAAEADAAAKAKALGEANARLMEQAKKMEDLERRLREMEEERRRLQQQLGEAPKEVAVERVVEKVDNSGADEAANKAKAAASAAEAKARKLEEQLRKVEKERDDLAEQLAKLKARKEKPVKVAEAGDGQASAALAAELDELRDELEAEQKKNKALEEDLLKEREVSAKLRRELEEALARVDDAERRAYAAECALSEVDGKPPPPPQQVTVVQGKDNSAELEELRQRCKDYDKLQAKLEKREKEIAALKKENEELKEQNEAMLKTLAQLKAQLKKVMEIAEKKGLGKLVNDLLAEAGLMDTLNSDDFSWFMRLYKDALRRMQKWKDLEKAKFISEVKEQPRVSVQSLGFEVGPPKPLLISDPQALESFSPKNRGRSPSRDMAMTMTMSKTSSFRVRTPDLTPAGGQNRSRSPGQYAEDDDHTPAGPLREIQVVGVSAVPRPNTPAGYGANFPPPPLVSISSSAPDLHVRSSPKMSQTFSGGFRPGVFGGASPKSTATEWNHPEAPSRLNPAPPQSSMFIRSAGPVATGSSRQRSTSKTRLLASSPDPPEGRHLPGPAPVFMAPYEASNLQHSPPPTMGPGPTKLLSRRWSAREPWHPAPEAAAKDQGDFLVLSGEGIRSPAANARPGSGPAKLDPIKLIQ